MKYLPPFDVIRRAVEVVTVRGEERVTVSYEDFVNMLKRIMAGIEVDDDWYIRSHEDIAQAIRNGSVQSARQHFAEDGYFEGRLPFPIRVDERWYLERYPDVAESVRKGIIASAQAHFDEDGYREGRLPFGL